MSLVVRCRPLDKDKQQSSHEVWEGLLCSLRGTDYSVTSKVHGEQARTREPRHQ